jgi:outer membrane scaffolding protein for murein synthesis (MipA/OmpV family)
MIHPVRGFAVALALLSLAPLDGRARDLPLWELGAGAAVIDFPDYRGSDERQSYVLPVPYIVYRGEVLQISREKVRGLFFKSDRAELDISLNGAVPVKSAGNQARQGMPDLDPTLEIGPSLNLFLIHSAAKKINLDLRLPLRPVIASDFSRTKQVGWVFQPQLNVDVRDLGGNQGLKLGLVAGPLFGDRRYHQYFYGVDPEFATPARPAYNAHGGYAGSQFIAAVSKRFPTYWVGGFMKWDTLNNAAFADSPLVKTKQYFTTGFAISWIFAESKIMVSENR